MKSKRKSNGGTSPKISLPRNGQSTEMESKLQMTPAKGKKTVVAYSKSTTTSEFGPSMT